MDWKILHQCHAIRIYHPVSFKYETEMFTDFNISASIAIISASASHNSCILILLFQKAQNMMQFPEDMATISCFDSALPVPI